MLYSEDRKFVLVAVPKTGSSTLQKHLLDIDPNLRRNAVCDTNGNWIELPTHATAVQIRAAMGSRAKKFTFVGFLRDPRDVVVSKYYFYRKGRAARQHGIVSRLARNPETKGRVFRPGTILRVLSAQILPLRLWAQLYPYKSSAYFITDAHGTVLVDRIGRMERLQKDALAIFTDFGYAPEDLQLGRENCTDYDRSVTCDPRVAKIVARRLPEDCALFDHLTNAERTIA
ncbi:hypothetical protein [Roseovarius sp.]|uniref:hypothetical protein n=1 Tax=Roseovarius sp. TaxID=1486281 RepID=UPI0035631AFE